MRIERRDDVTLILFHHFHLGRLSQQRDNFIGIHVEDDVTLAGGLDFFQQWAVVGSVVELPEGGGIDTVMMVWD